MKIDERIGARSRRTVARFNAMLPACAPRSSQLHLIAPKRSVARRGSTSMSAGFLAALSAIAAGILAVSAIGAGLYDSGWSVAKPSTVLEEHPTNDPAMRIAINQILEQSQVPLLPTPAPN